MRVKLAYGKRGLQLELPDDADVQVIENRLVPALGDPVAALRTALRSPLQALPLREQVGAGDRVAIVFSDITGFQGVYDRRHCDSSCLARFRDCLFLNGYA